MKPSRYLSPSALKTFKSCEQKFYFRYVENRKEPSKPWLEFGKALHWQNERYLKELILPDDSLAGRLAKVGLKDLPLPGDHLLVEQEIAFIHEGMTFYGFSDLIDTEPPFAGWGNEVDVYDYKSTKSFDWVRSIEDLKNDEQVLKYGMWCVTPDPYVPEISIECVNFHWVYYLTQGRGDVRVVSFSMSADEIRQRFAQILAVARKADSIKSEVVAPHTNASACDDYGGCTYKSICPLHTQKGKATVKLSDIIKQNLAQNAAGEAAKHVDAVLSGPTVIAPVKTPVAVTASVVPPDAPAPIFNSPTPLEAAEPKAKRGRKASTKDDVDMPKTVAVGLTEVINSFVLLVNTLPSKGATVTLMSDVLQPVLETLASDLGVQHYRAADEAGYGKADAMLLTAFKNSGALTQLQGYVYVDRRDGEAMALLAFLESQAAQVFRGGF